jgi:hypothetical protein
MSQVLRHAVKRLPSRRESRNAPPRFSLLSSNYLNYLNSLNFFFSHAACTACTRLVNDSLASP